MADNIYASPRTVTDLNECYFYHSMEIPGWGEMQGEWDLRAGVRDYLGNVALEGKRVLEIGVASGFLSFYMEQRGAEVIGYDLSDDYDWDILPDSGEDSSQLQAEMRSRIRKVNNAYWLAHRAFNSQAKVIYGTVYNIPEETGMVDLTTICSVLLHVRDPFLALQKARRLTRETVIVTDLFRDPRSRFYNVLPKSPWGRLWEKFRMKFGGPSMVCSWPYLQGDFRGTWWYLPPEVIQIFLEVLGFGETRVSYHLQKHVAGQHENLIKMYTVVGHRSVPN
jgi:SAM-dependent methyltransferase